MLVNPRHWPFITLILVGLILLSPLDQTADRLLHALHLEEMVASTSVDASEIYPMFTCSCCGQPLKKEDPCCGIMIGMIDFIDQQVSSGANKDEIILATAKEFGLERLTAESDREILMKELKAQAPENAPELTIPETKRNLGEISQSDGTVTTEFVIRNTGGSTLVIDKLSSSCGCTSGTVEYAGKEGPRFYMAGHGYDEPSEAWQVGIEPGDDAIVRVYYDPTVHPDLTGPVTRTLGIHSSDPVNFEQTLTITLEQVK